MHILYIQYTNPAAYPPLEHGSRALADAGWQVVFLGVGAQGSADMLAFPPHLRVNTRLMRYCPPGWRQKLHYLTYTVWVLWWVAWSRPGAVYCSGAIAAPVGLLAHWLFRVPVYYHEHDAPAPANSALMRVCAAARRRLARAARLCILPNGERLARFAAALRPRRTACVWNCPARDEVTLPRPPGASAGLTLWYHGALNPSLLPWAIVSALAQLPPAVTLRFAGYETIGHSGYVSELLRLAQHLEVAARVRYLGTLSRRELYISARQADVGLALIARQFPEPLVGASNKPFDYLACGLALLVTDTAEWESLYVGGGYARSCNPESPDQIATALRWFLENPVRTRAMGEAGRKRIAAEWNYETQFAPVMAQLQHET